MGNEGRFRRTHPYSLLRHVKIYAVLILLTIVQQVLVRPQDILAYIGSLGLNAIYVLAVLFYFVSDYTNRICRMYDGKFDVRSGIFVKRDRTIAYKKICCVAFHGSVISYLFNAESISVDTPGGFRKKYDFSAYFSRKRANEVKSFIESGKETAFTFRSRIISIILMSAFWSNPVTGIVFIVPVITNVSRLIGSDVVQRIIMSSVDSQWKIIAMWIPPAAALVAAFILMSWSISMLIVFLRYVRFKSMRLGDYIVTSKGLVSMTKIYTRVSGLSSASVDQSLFMKLLKLKSCSMTLVGGGKQKGDRNLLLSADSYDKVQSGMTELTGIPVNEEKVIKKAPRSIFSYIYYPLILLGIVILLLVLSYRIRMLTSTARMLLYIFMFILMWWLMFRIFAYFHSRIAVNEKCLIVCTFHRMTLKKHFIPFERIQYIELTQTPFQKRSGKCSLSVSLFCERRRSVRVKQLPLKETKELLSHEGVDIVMR